MKNFSHSHGDDAPQVDSLADEALDYALEHGVTLGKALAILQKREAWARGLTSQGQLREPDRHLRRIDFHAEPRGNDRFPFADPKTSMAPAMPVQTVVVVEFYVPEPGEVAWVEHAGLRITVENRGTR